VNLRKLRTGDVRSKAHTFFRMAKERSGRRYSQGYYVIIGALVLEAVYFTSEIGVPVW
jgi:hypothetical protein